MEELDVLESSNQYWQQQDGLLGEEELMIMGGYQLLDERTPAYAADYSKHQVDHDEETEGPRRRRETSMVNKLISTVYSGPTISDIESALSFTGGAGDHQLAVKYGSSPVVFSPEKVLSKMENKYTLKIKTCGNGLAEDGYKWRKYGQKSIKNSPNPRSYYRCTNPRCNAKKQVERALDEPDTLLVTYEGLHLHYTYSHFLHSAQVQHQQGLPKKPKRGPANSSSLLLSSDHDEVLNTNTPPAASNGGGAGDAAVLPGVSVSEAAASAAWSCFDGGDEEQQHHHHHMEADMANKNGGLLEDVVPLLVRRPCGSTTTTTTTGTGGSSQDNSPPSPSASSVPWTPTSPYIDMAILSNIF